GAARDASADGSQPDARAPATCVAGLTNGADHAEAREKDGTVWCWGQNTYAQLGDGTSQFRTTPVRATSLETSAVGISASSWYTCAIAADGSVSCWGKPDDTSLKSLTIGTDCGTWEFEVRHYCEPTPL